MGLRNRKGGAEPEATMSTDQDLNEEAKDLMQDHLELMKEVVMRIREDEEFARNIYADCPRLQNLLDRNPDLRPIFEDPNLVRINFEQVYRDAGGVLPEDEKARPKCLTWFVNSPIFKFLRFLLMIKKIMGCIAGGGIGMVTGCFMGMFCCGEDALPEDFDAEGDNDADVGNPENESNKEALNNAANYMEDPEVQQQMDKLMEDPEGLEEAIENDEELRALRDSNPLCAELMSDPETMKILTDPDNLRALGEAPDLIEADFADPNWTAPDLEMGDVDADMDASLDGSIDADAEADAEDEEGEEDVDAEGEEGGEDGDAEGEEGGEDVDADVVDMDGDGDIDDADGALWEDAQLEQQEAAQSGGNRGGGNAPQNRQQQREQTEGEGGGGIGASIATCARDLAAGALVGHLLGGGADFFGGGGDELDGVAEAADAAGGVGDAADGLDIDEDALDDAAEETANAGDEANKAAEIMDHAATASEVVGDTDYVDTLEEGMDGGQDAMDEHNASRRGDMMTGAAIGGATGAAIGGSAGAAADAKAKKLAEEAAAAEEEEKKKRGGWFGNMGSSIFTAAKEQMAATLLGDDLAEMLVEKLEDKDKDEDDDDKSDDDSDIEKDPEEEGEKSKRTLFGRSRT